MHYDLKIIPANDELRFRTDSALVKFFVDSPNLEKGTDDFFSFFKSKLPRIQKALFLEKKSTELRYYNPAGEPALILLGKIPAGKEFSTDYFRNYFAQLVPSLVKSKVKHVHIIVPGFKEFKEQFGHEAYFIRTMIEGLLLGNYSFDKYKSDNEKIEKIAFVFHYSDRKILNEAFDKSLKIMDAVYFARDLVNEPANSLTPEEFAKRVKRELVKINVNVEIYDLKELKKRKMNAILAVAGASIHPPCMIRLHYKPAGMSKKKIALIGKGVTYDSGGLSLKPTSNMFDMKADMAGGAAVIGAIKAAASLKLPFELYGIIPAVENMVSGSSYKPGDVIISASSKSIEVKDTDAEGRIILADALHLASNLKPDVMIDFATLTGACVVALGEFVAGLFTQNDQLADQLLESGKTTFERLWRLPLWDDYNTLIKSEIADVCNLGPRWGGAITAGKFLEKFVDTGIPWAHVDIAGPAVKHDFNNYTKKYDTGFGVRLIVEYLMRL